MDACKAQGVEAPTWCFDGGFVTITFKRPDFKSDIIENDKEDKKITEEGKAESDTRQGEVPLNHRPTTNQVPFKFKN